MKNYPEAPAILEKIKLAKNILLCLHISPDADSVGANLAMSAFLASQNIKHKIVSADTLPHPLSFLEGYETIEQKDPRDVSQDFDTLLFLDSAAAERITRHKHGIPFENKTVVVIDHHHSNPRFGQINIIDAEASSTGEIIYYLFNQWNFKISPQTANYLLAAISGDTGNFRFQTTAQTLKAAADLIEKGASLQDTNFNLYRRIPLPTLQYQAEVIQSAQKIEVGSTKFLFAAMPSEKIKELGGLEYAHGGSQQMNDIEGIDFGVVIDEEEDGFVAGSLRSRTGIDVSEIAALFGGGGHIAAAGFHTKIEGTFEEKKRYVLEKIIKYLKNEKVS